MNIHVDLRSNRASNNRRNRLDFHSPSVGREAGGERRGLFLNKIDLTPACVIAREAQFETLGSRDYTTEYTTIVSRADKFDAVAPISAIIAYPLACILFISPLGIYICLRARSECIKRNDVYEIGEKKIYNCSFASNIGRFF